MATTCMDINDAIFEAYNGALPNATRCDTLLTWRSSRSGIPSCHPCGDKVARQHANKIPVWRIGRDSKNHTRETVRA
eukprot:scaffold587372_cov122-Attheya_sp.AAC.1